MTTTIITTIIIFSGIGGAAIGWAIGHWHNRIQLERQAWRDASAAYNGRLRQIEADLQSATSIES